jgi:hypothetical protein
MNYYEAGMDLLKRHNVTVIKYRNAMSGRAIIAKAEIKTPIPKTAKSFAIFAHEVGHIVNGEIKPSCMCEYKAEMFARDCFKEYGFKMPRIVKNRQIWYICYSLAQALNRGMKNIPAELKPYVKLLIKCNKVAYHNGVKKIEPYYRADNKLYKQS